MDSIASIVPVMFCSRQNVSFCEANVKRFIYAKLLMFLTSVVTILIIILNKLLVYDDYSGMIIGNRCCDVHLYLSLPIARDGKIISVTQLPELTNRSQRIREAE